MIGDSILMHPVLKPDVIRDDFYFPAGSWVDFKTYKTTSNERGIYNHKLAEMDIVAHFRAGSTIPIQLTSEDE